jgi:hypothetical protein
MAAILKLVKVREQWFSWGEVETEDERGFPLVFRYRQ